MASILSDTMPDEQTARQAAGIHLLARAGAYLAMEAGQLTGDPRYMSLRDRLNALLRDDYRL